jgi:hypothetical protein
VFFCPEAVIKVKPNARITKAVLSIILFLEEIYIIGIFFCR